MYLFLYINIIYDTKFYYNSGSRKLSSNVGDLITQSQLRTRELSFIARPQNNGAVFKCVASSDATAEPVREESRNITVYCKYSVRGTVESSVGGEKGKRVLERGKEWM